MNDRFTAFSISSMHMKMTMGFLRTSTPNAPMVKSAALSHRAGTLRLMGIRGSRKRPALREDHHPDDADQQEDGGQLERVDVAGEQVPADDLDLRHLRGFEAVHPLRRLGPGIRQVVAVQA